MNATQIVFPRVFLAAAVLLAVGASPAEAAKKTARKPAVAPSPTSFSTVVVDAGHGGHDPGGIPQNIIHEKGVALDVATRLKTHLETAGLRVVMTRTDDVFVTLGERVRIANAQQDAIFVSIHFNSALRAEARGVEGYYGSPSAAPLAELIHERLLPVTVNPDYRPVKHATFWVLRETKCPAVLVECGFLTNPQDAAAASEADYRETLAREIAGAVVEHRRSSAPAEATQGSKLQAMD